MDNTERTNLRLKTPRKRFTKSSPNFSSKDESDSLYYKYEPVAPSLKSIKKAIKKMPEISDYPKQLFYSDEKDLVLHYSDQKIRHPQTNAVHKVFI